MLGGAVREPGAGGAVILARGRRRMGVAADDCVAVVCAAAAGPCSDVIWLPAGCGAGAGAAVILEGGGGGGVAADDCVAAVCAAAAGPCCTSCLLVLMLLSKQAPYCYR